MNPDNQPCVRNKTTLRQKYAAVQHLRVPGSFCILQVAAVHVTHHGGPLTGLGLVGGCRNVWVQAEALARGKDGHHGSVACSPEELGKTPYLLYGS